MDVGLTFQDDTNNLNQLIQPVEFTHILAVPDTVAERGKRHRLDMVIAAALENGNLTDRSSLSQDDESKISPLQFPTPPTSQPPENLCQELCALMGQLRSKASVQFWTSLWRLLRITSWHYFYLSNSLTPRI